MDSPKQTTVASDVSYHEFSHGHEIAVDQGNGEVLLDIGYGKAEPGTSTLKTTKDGHVSSSTSMGFL